MKSCTLHPNTTPTKKKWQSGKIGKIQHTITQLKHQNINFIKYLLINQDHLQRISLIKLEKRRNNVSQTINWFWTCFRFQTAWISISISISNRMDFDFDLGIWEHVFDFEWITLVSKTKLVSFFMKTWNGYFVWRKDEQNWF